MIAVTLILVASSTIKGIVVAPIVSIDRVEPHPTGHASARAPNQGRMGLLGDDWLARMDENGSRV
jgi:hypothetical protein